VANVAASYNLRGLAYFTKGDFGKALADLGTAVARDPEFAEAFINRANVYRAKDDLEHAKQDLETALELDPTFSAANEALAQVQGPYSYSFKLRGSGGPPEKRVHMGN
jgi:Tfp pilus assembly protein PilF